MSKAIIETGTEDLLAFEESAVGVITLNRPQARNAMSTQMNLALARVLDEMDRRTSIRCIVLTGAGNAFCAGGDVKGMNASGDSLGKQTDQPTIDQLIRSQRLNQRDTAGKIFTMPKPVIASLPGAAAGAGCSLALAADLRIMSNDAFITTAFARVGLAGDYGGSFFLSHLVGAGKAKELYFFSERIDAPTCLALGIANRVVAADELMDTTMALAKQLANGPSIALGSMKENINRAVMGADVNTCLDLEASHHVHSRLTEDHRQAAKAFVLKTTPKFIGR